METTEVFRINKDGSVTIFEATIEQYQEAIKMLIDYKNTEIERLREALDEAETICLAHCIMLMCAGENEKAERAKNIADKLAALQ